MHNNGPNRRKIVGLHLCPLIPGKGIKDGEWKELPNPKRNHYGGGLAVMNDRLVLFGKLSNKYNFKLKIYSNNI